MPISKLSGKMWILLLAWTCGLMMGRAREARGQNLIVANPAEVRDFRAGFVNPGVIAFQEAHAALGGKIFHLGFVDGQGTPFRQGYVSLALPTGISDEMGLGLQAQYFSTPLYSQSNLSFLISRRLQNKYAFGIRFNLFSRSFNQENFDLVDPDDPVFRNGTTQWGGTFGAGVVILPLPFLSLGIGIDHINRANISLTNDDVYQPFRAYLGGTVDFGSVQATFSTSYGEGRWLPKASVSTTFRHQGYAMVGVSENALQAEGQWRISGPLSLNYNYEYTLFDNQGVGQGSHAVTLVHEFDRKPSLPKFEIPEAFRAEFQPPDRGMAGESPFYVYSVVDKMEIIEKKLTRVIDPGLTQEQLTQLTLHELGVLDSSRAENASPYEQQAVDLGRIPATLETTLSEGYQTFVKEVSEEINESGARARVITPKETYLRAAGLRRYFSVDSLDSERLAFIEPVYKSRRDSLYATQKVGDRPIKPFESLVTLSPAVTTFQITPVARVHPQQWRLVIKDNHVREVWRFEGVGRPMSEMQWDWRDAWGKVVQPGVYSYALEWEDESGETRTTEKKYITVQKLLRHIRIEVTNQQKDTGVEADEIEIILKR
ncbi:MAG: type IX secretion system membrane protein PorP/SprF [bacterium]